MKKKLTKRIVDSLPFDGTEQRIMDTVVNGFGVRRRGEGQPVYFVRYRIHGERRLKTIGRHGSPWAVESARNEAKRLLGLVAGNQDPLEVSATRMRVSDLCDRYVEELDAGRIFYRGKIKKTSTIATDKGRIERHIKPLLGKKQIGGLSRRDIEKFRDDITEGKSAADERTGPHGRAIVRGGAGTAARTLGLLGGILTYARRQGLIDDNPVHGVDRKSDRRRLQSLSKSDYKAIGKAIRQLREMVPKGEVTGLKRGLDVVVLIALTGCRKSEIQTLKPSAVDISGQCIRFDDTKTGAQIRPIGKKAAQFLKNLKFDTDREFVFPAVFGKSFFVGTPKVWGRIRVLSGRSNVSLHTFRHGYASVAAELGYSQSTISALLGHAGHTITDRYIHLTDKILIAAANEVSKEISKRMQL